jgi:hypothetical protein
MHWCVLTSIAGDVLTAMIAMYDDATINTSQKEGFDFEGSARPVMRIVMRTGVCIKLPNMNSCYGTIHFNDFCCVSAFQVPL